MILTLPWPPKELSPNARQHWATLARAKRIYRATCATLARSQGAGRQQGVQSLVVALTFHAPTKRAYDLDNALARCKAGIDGLADVLGVDDSLWTFQMARGAPVKGGAVLVEVGV